MTSWRRSVGCLVVAASIAVGAPASAIAAGGGSAGDQQYVDPLAGLHSHTHKSSTPSTQPAPTSSSSPSTPSGSGSGASAPTQGSQTTATATSSSAAAGTTTATTASGGRKLPFTGFDPLPGVTVGAALIAGGLVLRRKSA